MDWDIGVLAAVTAIYALVAVCAVVFRVRRPSELEHGPNALLSTTLATLALSRIAALRHEGPIASAERHATLLAVVAVALVVHFALEYAQHGAPPSYAARKRSWIRRAWIVAAVLGVTTMLVEIHEGSTPLPGYELGVVGIRLTPLGAALHVVLLAELVAVTAVVARSYLRGSREAIAVTMGLVALLAALVLDVLHGLGQGLGLAVGQLGFFGLVLGVTAAFVWRYTGAAGELELRSGQLESLTTELRKSYQDLRAAKEELSRKEQLAVVGELAAVVAHEVRNPLAVIANAVAGLRKPTLSKDDQTTLLEILDEETRRLNRLVSDLLRYARPVSVQRARIPLAELLDRPLALATKAGVTVVRTKNVGEDVRVWGDASLLRQVFDNLIENAVQAMGHGGTLTVDTEPRSEDSFEGLAIAITDTGEGMDTLVRARAKDPFFTTRPSGTGLGLAIVDRIVEAHGGHLLIESRPGEGTTVTVCLPTAPPSEVGTRALPDRDDRGEGVLGESA